MRTIAILLCLLFCLPTRAKKMDENNQIPQKDISIRFNFGIASANQEGTGESLWYSNPPITVKSFVRTFTRQGRLHRHTLCGAV